MTAFPDKAALKREMVQIVKDMHEKCGSDVIAAMARSANLVDDNAGRIYVAMGGVQTAGMTMAVTMSDREKEDTHPSKISDVDIADRALFAMLFTWFNIAPDRRGETVRAAIVQTTSAWERITGKSFDPSWLIEGVWGDQTPTQT